MVFENKDTSLPYSFHLNKNYVLELLNDMEWDLEKAEEWNIHYDTDIDCYCDTIENEYLNYYCAKQYPDKFEEWFEVNFNNYIEWTNLNMTRKESDEKEENND